MTLQEIRDSLMTMEQSPYRYDVRREMIELIKHILHAQVLFENHLRFHDQPGDFAAEVKSRSGNQSDQFAGKPVRPRATKHGLQSPQ